VGVLGRFFPVKSEEIGRSIRIEPKAIEQVFELHRKRLGFYELLSTSLYSIVSLIIFGLVLIGILAIISLFNNSSVITLTGITLNIVSWFVSGFSAVIAAKIVAVILDSYYADSLVLLSSFYLLIDLNHTNNLSNPEFKRRVLDKVYTLRRNLLLLSRTFNATQDDVSHIREIDNYVREREEWIVSHKKNTLKVLRKDFDELAILLINGEYGEFKSKKKLKIKEVNPSPLSFTDKILHAIFLFFPYGILLILYFTPEYTANLGLNNTTVFLVAIAWILLTIDARLKLGFVERVAGLAKTMKELR